MEGEKTVGFWMELCLIFVLFLGSVVVTYWIRREEADDEEEVYHIGRACCILFGVFLFVFILDIPSAVTGGVKIKSHLDVCPMQTFSAVYTEDKMLVAYGKIMDIGDDEGQYLISYTPVTKSIIKIEKVHI